jgi:predicted GIY-YIG superfamily endonuclease
MHYVYLLRSVATPGRKYVGYSDDLRRRLSDHNSGRNASTATARPWRLQTYLACSAKEHALAFERYLKSGSGHAFARKRLWAPPSPHLSPQVPGAASGALIRQAKSPAVKNIIRL